MPTVIIDGIETGELYSVDSQSVNVMVTDNFKLSEEELVTFKVVLQEGEDIASRKKLLEDEGMKINAVKDHNHAVVTAKRDVFGNLQQRIGRYRDEGRKKDFASLFCHSSV